MQEDFIATSALQHIAFLREAKKRRIKVSNSDIRREISMRFTRQNMFDAALYERWVTNVTGQSLRQYEEGVRDELLVIKMKLRPLCCKYRKKLGVNEKS